LATGHLLGVQTTRVSLRTEFSVAVPCCGGVGVTFTGFYHRKK
jgi:hypothetical protein